MESAIRNKNVQKWALFTLAWPIFIEISLHMIMGNVDTWMLGMVSDHAVAAVGVANQILLSAIVMFGFVATGTSVLVAQYLGAGEHRESARVAQTAIALNTWFGILISITMMFVGPSLLRWMGIPHELLPDAKSFLFIVGGFLFTEALMITMSAIARAHGYTKAMMWITIWMNVINIIGNSLVLFGPFANEEHAITGVAISTTISRILGLFGVWVILRKKVGHSVDLRDFVMFRKPYVNRLLLIGVPSAGEQLSYQTSQLYITYFVTMLGAQALATKIYVQNMTFIVLLFSLSIASATQILIGHLVGSRQLEAAYQRGMRSLWQAMGLSFTVAILVWWLSPFLLDWFTDDSRIIALGQQVMMISVFLEPGRCFNLVLISSLRASGDTKFPMMMGMISMWGLSVPLAYWFGVKMGWGLPGVFVALAVDEWFRGLAMYGRWRSRAWESKSPILSNVLEHT